MGEHVTAVDGVPHELVLTRVDTTSKLHGRCTTCGWHTSVPLWWSDVVAGFDADHTQMTYRAVQQSGAA